MFATITKNQIRNDETYITLYGVFTYDETKETFEEENHQRGGDGRFIKGNCKEITQKWMKSIEKGNIYKAKEINVEGKNYKLTENGYKDKDIRITFKAQKRETEEQEEFVRNAIHEQTGAKIIIYPRIEIMKGKRTPDILMGISNNKYEIKTLEKKAVEEKNTFIVEAKKAKGQADNIIFNASSKFISMKTARKWLNEIYIEPDTRFVKRTILLYDGKIDRVLMRDNNKKDK